MTTNLIDPISGKYLSDGLVKIEERVSSALTYIGRCINSSGDKTAAIWQIERQRTNGGMVTTDYALNGQFKGIWNDRESYFQESVILNNNYSLRFDGVNDYVTLGNNFNFEHSEQFSYSFWMYADNFSALRYIMAKVSPSPDVYGLRIGHNTSGNIVTQVRAPGDALGLQTFNTVLTAQTWYHIVFTWDGGSNVNSQRLYINGVQDTYVPSSNTLINSWLNTDPFVIAQSGLDTNYFSGNIDEFSVYSKALSLSEVQEIYNSGQPALLNELATNLYLESWYRMGDDDVYPTLIDNYGNVNGTMINMTSNDIEAEVP